MAVKKINCYGCEHRLKKENEVSNADGCLFSASLSKCHWHFFIFQSEKNLKDYGDKIPAEKKSAIESALNELKAAHSARNVQQIDQAMAKINARLAGRQRGHVQSPAAGRR